MGIEITFGASVREQYLSIAALVSLCVIYLYLLLSPAQLRVPTRLPSFIIQRETKANFDVFMQSFNEARGGGLVDDWSKYKWGEGSNFSSNSMAWDDVLFNSSSEGALGAYNRNRNRMDDFFLYTEGLNGGGGGQNDPFGREKEREPLVPSDKFFCTPGSNGKKDWVSIRSESNYKQLWMHSVEHLWMGASATMDTPLHRKTFEVVPVDDSCSNGGWVRLREADLDGFSYLVTPLTFYTPPGVDITNYTQSDEWVVKEGSSSLEDTLYDKRYHFLLEQDGFIMNNASNGCINILSAGAGSGDYPVRGHTEGWQRSALAASREYSAMVKFSFVNESQVMSSMLKEKEQIAEAKELDQKYIEMISKFETGSEKRVISYGLYGSKPKYMEGAIKNADLAKTYFPGWICRFYVSSDVPEEIVSKLKALGAEIESVPNGMGYVSGMFWRFMIAGDNTVDRYIIRDVDSRLNSRDRFAVEEWIKSGYAIHILRDHVNHCLPINGGMWGGVKGALPNIAQQINDWKNRDEYSSDLHFLEEIVWPEVKDKQMSHDSYCCDRYPNTKPYPLQRFMTYQHVGQVFDQYDNPRMLDIDGYIRGMPIPSNCRKFPDWIYG